MGPPAPRPSQAPRGFKLLERSVLSRERRGGPGRAPWKLPRQGEIPRAPGSFLPGGAVPTCPSTSWPPSPSVAHRHLLPQTASPSPLRPLGALTVGPGQYHLESWGLFLFNRRVPTQGNLAGSGVRSLTSRETLSLSLTHLGVRTHFLPWSTPRPSSPMLRPVLPTPAGEKTSLQLVCPMPAGWPALTT